MPTVDRRRPVRARDPFDVSHLVAADAERQVLAGVLDLVDRETATAREIAGGLTVEMFQGDGTGDVFKATCNALGKVAEPTIADVLTALRGDGLGQGTDAYALLISLAEDRIGTGSQAARLAREAATEVRRVHERRQAIEAAGLVVNGAGHPDDVGALIRHLERVRAASDAAGSRPMTLIDCMEAWRKHERTPVVPTGLHWFDDPTDGGLPIGGIVALVAYPKAGKSALALQLTLAAMVTDPTLNAVWALGEMSPAGLGCRMTCVGAAILPGCSPVTMHDASRRTKAARDACMALCNAVGDRLSIVRSPLSVEAIEARVAATGAKVVVIDYLQLLRSPENTTDRVHELESIVSRIREMAITRECVVLMISSMAKSAGTASRIGQFGKGTGEIDYAVELLYVGEREEHDGRPVIGPDGTVGVTWRCRAARNLDARDLALRFDGATQTYTAEPTADAFPPVNGYAEFDGFAPRSGS